MQRSETSESKNTRKRGNDNWRALVIVFLLLAIICAGAYLRTIGVDWDAGRHLHPDERFLSMVLNSMTPVKSVGEYFNTDASTLNPGNVGYDFFVYGTLPLFIIRYVGEWVGQVGYDPITIVGRQLSALADIFTILLVFLIALRLFNSKAALLAAALYAFAVLPIQQSHFMTVDTFTNTFGMLTVYLGVVVLTRPSLLNSGEEPPTARIGFGQWFPYAAFGLALGMAAASKINAVSLALLLPAVEAVRFARLKPEEREVYGKFSLKMILLAALVSLLSFRVFQPYAFSGTSFFTLGLNREWLDGLKSLAQQSTGNVDFPPALQWARRSVGFSLYNLVFWGLGIPFGVLALLSLGAMGWAGIIKKNLTLLPVWAWTLFYLLWQLTAWVKAMRYLLLIYPLLAVIAAWGIVSLWQARRDLRFKRFKLSSKMLRNLGIALAVLTVLGTGAYAYAFTRIYTRPHTRVAATTWIYDNIPGPVNLVMRAEDSEKLQQAPYRSGDALYGSQTRPFVFTSWTDGALESFSIPTAQYLSAQSGFNRFTVTIERAGGLGMPLRLPVLSSGTNSNLAGTGAGVLEFQFDPPISLEKDAEYVLSLVQTDPNSQVLLSGVPKVGIRSNEGELAPQSLDKIVESITPTHAYSMDISVMTPGEITAVELPYLLDLSQNYADKTLKVTLRPTAEQDNQPVSGTVSAHFVDLGGGKGTTTRIVLDRPLRISNAQVLSFSLEMTAGEGTLAVSSVAPVHESSWDDALPVSEAGYVPYSDNGGIFRGDLNLELYWPDNADKRERFIDLLQQGDYLFISSNRQWGTTTRVPERYPLTSFYYRELLGCPESLDLVSCYNTAEPGMYSGSLGFDLVKTVTSYPTLGNWQFNDQFAEEAFSVYDHPKVLIFRKNADFDPTRIREIFESVDLSYVVNLTPRQADKYDTSIAKANNLMLTSEALAVQRAGGTWSRLFDRLALVNTSQTAAVIIFYLFSFALGLFVYPILRLAMPGLADKGYAFSRLAGFLLIAFFALILGSNGIAVTRTLIGGICALIALAGVLAAVLSRRELLQELKQNWKQYLVIELLALIAFLFFLWVRYQNPDLWHPYKGGEKPMDFSYFNAVIKSTTFPAYDPWYAGGYINYYYYGFIILGMPVKLLGIIPSVAYNIILPLWYSLLFIGAYSVGWNITRAILAAREGKNAPELGRVFGKPFAAGLCTALLLAFVGNLGTVRLLSQTLQVMGAGGAAISGASVLSKLSWLFRGFGQLLKGTPMPLYPGDWYWFPSRVIPGDPITEFPYFTFIYADLHAHLIAMPIAVFAVAWGLSALLSKCRWGTGGVGKWLGFALSFFIGALVIGALKPTNTWDYYTFLLLNLFILGYCGWKYLKPAGFVHKEWLARLLPAAGMIVMLVALSMLLYSPFNQLFHPGYNQIGIWTGDRTPLSSYFTHWGLLLFIIVFWYVWETYQLLAVTPLSALKKLEPHQNLLKIGGALFGVLLLVLLFMKVSAAIIVLPLCLWSLVLLLRSGQSDAKKLMFFLVATALLETLVVELVYLVGDIGRMNVVFKLYMQAWLLLALAAGSGLVMLWTSQHKWTLRTQLLFQLPLILLAAGALLFPLLGTTDKINDRMNPSAPKTLDGMQYMLSSSYYDMGVDMPLEDDYYTIRWMQDNISGSPVIVEAQAYEYRWGNRYTIYTGLPGVVGWNYHQRQQRAILQNNAVQNRVDEVNKFYLTDDLDFVREFIDKYQVSYIIVGRLEKAFYPGGGLEKFESQAGILWDQVFQYDSTVVYKVR
jgi:YYY domain-containing protein